MGTRVLEEGTRNRKYKPGNDGKQPAKNFMKQDLTSRFESGDFKDREDIMKQMEQQEQMKRFAGFGIGIASVFAENVLSHPCVVLRRQCQVNHNGKWYHLTPFTLFQVAINLSSSQGPVTFWKGIGSTFAVRATVMMAETAISEVTSFPKEISRHVTFKKFGQHLLVKSLANVLATPFYAASLPETVQSDIASERPGVLDCYREGIARIMGWGMPPTTRLLPIWQLIVPTVGHRVCHYLISYVAQSTVTSAMRSEQHELRGSVTPDEAETPEGSLYDTYFPELLATFTGSLLADMMLYPLETVIHRLYIQGTRTIIDNVDKGFGVLPINTRYDGFVDCVRTILDEEGISGFYRGFGALVMQYCLHAAILKMAKILFERFSPPANSRNRSR